MDSGATIPGEEETPEFDPLTPLLPEEVCWILDRVFACEVNAERPECSRAACSPLSCPRQLCRCIGTQETHWLRRCIPVFTCHI